MNRKLCIDGAEMSVIATTSKGESNAVYWGWTPATARPLPTRDEIAEELTGWPSVAIDEARDMANTVLALLKGQDT